MGLLHLVVIKGTFKKKRTMGGGWNSNMITCGDFRRTMVKSGLDGSHVLLVGGLWGWCFECRGQRPKSVMPFQEYTNHVAKEGGAGEKNS